MLCLIQNPSTFVFQEFPVLFLTLRRKPMKDDQRFRIVYHIFIYLVDAPGTAPGSCSVFPMLYSHAYALLGFSPLQQEQ